MSPVCCNQHVNLCSSDILGKAEDSVKRGLQRYVTVGCVSNVAFDEQITPLVRVTVVDTVEISCNTARKFMFFSI